MLATDIVEGIRDGRVTARRIVEDCLANEHEHEDMDREKAPQVLVKEHLDAVREPFLDVEASVARRIISPASG